MFRMQSAFDTAQPGSNAEPQELDSTPHPEQLVREGCTHG
jgi:hypothetical protein